jgi:hypothetical protein
MKLSLIKKAFQHTRLSLILILKLTLIGLLFPIKTIAVAPLVILGVKITCEAIGAFCAGAILLITLYDHTRGYFEVEQQKWRYERGTRTVYKEIEIEQRWIAEQLNVAGNWKYRYTCQSEHFSEKKYIELRNEFTISECGSMGDVPLEVRDSICEYWIEDDYSEPNRVTQKLFSYSNQTQFSVRCKLSWKNENAPWRMPQQKDVTLTLLDWTPELNNCEEASRYRSTRASFPGTIPANGLGNITVKSRWSSGSMIQLSCGPNAGIAVE